MDIRFGAVRTNKMQVRRTKDRTEVSVDLVFNGPDLKQFRPLLGTNSTLNRTNNVLGLRYAQFEDRDTPVFYALATHTQREFGQSSLEKHTLAHQSGLMNRIKAAMGETAEPQPAEIPKKPSKAPSVPEGYYFDEKHLADIKSPQGQARFEKLLGRLNDVLSPEWTRFFKQAHQAIIK